MSCVFHHPNSSFYYFTASSSKESLYIEPSHPVPLVPKFISFPKLRKIKMSKENCSLMKEWAQEHGKYVRQRSARQETTKKKAGTLPLSMYRRPQPILDDVQYTMMRMKMERQMRFSQKKRNTSRRWSMKI